MKKGGGGGGVMELSYPWSFIQVLGNLIQLEENKLCGCIYKDKRNGCFKQCVCVCVCTYHCFVYVDSVPRCSLVNVPSLCKLVVCI